MKKREKDSVKNTADKFIRTYCKAEPINFLLNRMVVVVWKEKKRRKTSRLSSRASVQQKDLFTQDYMKKEKFLLQCMIQYYSCSLFIIRFTQ